VPSWSCPTVKHWDSFLSTVWSHRIRNQADTCLLQQVLALLRCDFQSYCAAWALTHSSLMYREHRYLSAPASTCHIPKRAGDCTATCMTWGPLQNQENQKKNLKTSLFPSLFCPHVLASAWVVKWWYSILSLMLVSLGEAISASHLNKLCFMLGKVVSCPRLMRIVCWPAMF